MNLASVVQSLIPKGTPIPITMDPVTAAFNALTAFNQFLITPAGQKFATDQEAIFIGLMNLLHVRIGTTMPAASAVAPAAPTKS